MSLFLLILALVVITWAAWPLSIVHYLVLFLGILLYEAAIRSEHRK